MKLTPLRKRNGGNEHTILIQEIIQPNMKNDLTRGFFLVVTILIIATIFTNTAFGQSDEQMVRIAKLTIDPEQLIQYHEALKEGIEAAVRIEPGVLAYYAVADKGNPTEITILEVYANVDSYKAHIETPHFKKYKATTQNMVKSLKLIDVDVIDFVIKKN